MEIRDTTAIVTGASGLGAATAAALVEAGAHVVGIDLQAQVDDALTREGITYVAADITDPEQVAVAVEQAASFPEPLRTVVSCAGIGPSMRILGKKGPHDLAFYAKVVQVNLLGTFNVMTLAAEQGATLDLLFEGADEAEAADALEALFERGFGEAM